MPLAQFGFFEVLRFLVVNDGSETFHLPERRGVTWMNSPTNFCKEARL
jgi:hypothetical protein